MATTPDIVERLQAAANEVESFPHPSHCEHLHIAEKVMREAAAEILRLRAELEAAKKDAAEVQALLPGPYYMDPPDGGSVTVLEQLQRMAKDAGRYWWLRSQKAHEWYEIAVHWFSPWCESDYFHVVGDVLDAAIDAEMAKE